MSYWQILDSRVLDRPTDWDRIFGRRAPLVVEVGFGRGDYLAHLGQTQPDANVLGIEISQPSLRKGSSKVRNQRLGNVRIVDGSAPTVLWLNVAPQAIAALHVNFPDPWHKDAHQERRLINPAFLLLAATRMQPGAPLLVATDHPVYQPVVSATLADCAWFDNTLPTLYTTDPGDRFRTKYELKALAEGRTPFYYHFRRNDRPAPDTFAIPEELPMPHAVISAPLTLEQIQHAFAPFEVAEENGRYHVGFKALFAGVQYRALLVETYIRQEPQDQRVGLSIIERAPGDFLIKLHDLGFPRSTDGVHFAVGCLAAWLTSLHPQAQISHHTLQPFAAADTL